MSRFYGEIRCLLTVFGSRHFSDVTEHKNGGVCVRNALWMPRLGRKRVESGKRRTSPSHAVVSRVAPHRELSRTPNSPPSLDNGLWDIGSTRRLLVQLFREPRIGPSHRIESMTVARPLLFCVSRPGVWQPAAHGA